MVSFLLGLLQRLLSLCRALFEPGGDGAFFEPVNIYGIFNLSLTLKCDHALFKMLQSPTTHAIDMTEDIDEVVEFFGCKYIIKERKNHIDSPVIDNLNDVKSMLDAGQEAVTKIVSSTGKLIMHCKC